jgi:hypothetical protein
MFHCSILLGLDNTCGKKQKSMVMFNGNSEKVKFVWTDRLRPIQTD